MSINGHITANCPSCKHQFDLNFNGSINSVPTQPSVKEGIKVVTPVVQTSDESRNRCRNKVEKTGKVDRVRNPRREKLITEYLPAPVPLPSEPVSESRSRRRLKDEKESKHQKCLDPFDHVNAYAPDLIKELNDTPDLPIGVTIKHQGFWITDKSGKHVGTMDEGCDRNSIMLTPECMLYVYKLVLRHLLLSMKVLTPHNVDNQNLVPHIMIRKDKSDPHSAFSTINGEDFFIAEADLSIKSDFLLVELDRDRDLHMTLCYKKKIKELVDMKSALSLVIKILNKHPELIARYQALPYFAEANTKYWYDTPNSFPFNLEVPENYKPIVKQVSLSSYSMTPAGSVVVKDR